MSSFGINSRRKSSRRAKKARPFGKLTIDTSFATQGKTFPYESRVQELSFVSFEESKARKNAFSKRETLKEQLEGRLGVHAGPRQGIPVVGGTAAPPARSVAGDIGDEESRPPPPQNRVKGLRPTPLDLSQNVSPSEQAITIGIAVPSTSVSQHSWSPQSPPETTSQAHQSSGRRKYAQDVATPIIVITPARDNFSPSDLAPHRPASSVYSRCTNCYPNYSDDAAPPVPPLPLFEDAEFPKSKWSMSTAPPRESAYTSFEEDLPTGRIRETKMHLKNTQPTRSVSKASTAGLPTPRRSKGWWNVITSPFSAKSVGSHFWKSPGPEDRMPILGDQGEMAESDPHSGVIFTNRHPDDEALRSAPAVGPEEKSMQEPATSLKRSDTAPAALDPSTSEVNIYRVPSSGEAAAYYDSNKHFPSLYMHSRAVDDDLLGWSPSHSVFMPDRSSEQRAKTLALMTGDQDESKKEIIPPAESKAADMPDPSAHGGVPMGATIFSSPSEDELKSVDASPPLPGPAARQATIDSMLSPLSATPKVQDAHIAHFVGPHSSYGEQKQVEVTEAPTPSHYGLSFATLGAATISHSQTGAREIPPIAEKSFPPPAHVRQDSYGLGISDSESERELFPPPPQQFLSEKPRLGTDRFGQLTVHNGQIEDAGPTQPWYRRFFWQLAAIIGLLLILLIVCLVMFVPQKHSDDTPVNASWINTTGFPPLPAGIATVVQPRLAEKRDTCVEPKGLWDCGTPDNGGLPNFRFEIRFRNGSLPANETQSVTKRWQDKSALHKFVRRSTWSEYLYSPSPAVPKQAEQEFLGKTTDNTTAGEETPFYLSLLDAVKLTKRGDGNFTYPYPTDYDAAATNAPKDIPSAASAAQLYPYMESQPLRLFDRGLDTEHYGFYNYFSKSLYMTGLTSNSTTNATANMPQENATSICTFSQTRFLVQIWTKKGSVSALRNATAIDFTPPGSFPYPVTLTLDRHGGQASSKGVYCYALDAEHNIVQDSGRWVDENRAAEGTIVNAAEVPGSNSTSSSRTERDDSSDNGGIDGGTGGCACAWENFK